MARIRSTHPGQWTDDLFVMCSFPARLLALGLRNEADDNGIFEWNLVKIKMRLFPADNVDVAALLDEITEHQQVKPYEIDGKQLGIIRNFQKWQKPKAPHFLYSPPLNLSDFGNGYSLSKTFSPDKLPHFGKTSSEGGGRREEEGDSSGGNPPESQRFKKPTLQELTEAFTGKVANPAGEAEKFLNFYESKGWMVGKNKMASWPHAVGNWAQRAGKSQNPDEVFYQ